MKWDLTDLAYPQIDIHQDHIEGLSKWVNKIAQLASEHGGEWNVLVGDLWPNEPDSRLIGHVQMSNVAVGYDTGFRVCAYLENGGIVGDSGDDLPLIREWLTEAVAASETNSILNKLADENEFRIQLTKWGEGDLEGDSAIAFRKT